MKKNRSKGKYKIYLLVYIPTLVCEWIERFLGNFRSIEKARIAALYMGDSCY